MKASLVGAAWSVTMQIGKEFRLLTTKWRSQNGWPRRLEWLEIKGLRGWTGQRFRLDYPIIAVVGENGVGKSTILQAAASIYKSPKPLLKGRGFASDFFPSTAWDTVKEAEVKFSIRQGDQTLTGAVRKPTERWLGNSGRPERTVVYIDLSRILPVPARVGYYRIAKSPHAEASAEAFDATRLGRLCEIMARPFDLAKMSISTVDKKREIPVLGYHGKTYSGFHQGAGETTVAELLRADLPQHSLVLIDEIETSLHPRAQRRLIRDLAERCRERELQIILTTHSPFVLSELPQEARAYIVETESGRNIVYGVSPEFAMTKMDDVPQHECDLYMEDRRAQAMITEILFAHATAVVDRCRAIPYGAASVGQALGIMVSQSRFPRPSVVFLDGDQAPSTGCRILPGGDAPEVVVFTALKQRNWLSVAGRIGRDFSALADVCDQAMTIGDPHEWVRYAASAVHVSSDLLWQVMCGEWAKHCLAAEDAKGVSLPIEDALAGIAYAKPKTPVALPKSPVGAAPILAEAAILPDDDPIAPMLPFGQ